MGAGAIINGALWMLKPGRVHEKTLQEGGSKSLTRIGGAAILNMGASHLVAGLSNNPGRNKQHLQAWPSRPCLYWLRDGVCCAPCECQLVTLSLSNTCSIEHCAHIAPECTRSLRYYSMLSTRSALQL